MIAVQECPFCSRPLLAQSWRDDRHAFCGRCEKLIEFIPLPALTAQKTVARPQTASLGEDATCFFHTGNRAESVCSGCGRLLCAVCAVDYTGTCLCPACIATRSSGKSDTVTSRVLWANTALSLAILPLLIWPVTVLTAPTVIGLSIYGWNKPGSLVRKSKRRFVMAIILAGLQLAGWSMLLVNILLH
jgi:uncharacterized paraquat-inducible protein A